MAFYDTFQIIKIMTHSWSTGTGKQAVGIFDDFRLYSRPLSTTEITDL
jgi:hypothetical protein